MVTVTSFYDALVAEGIDFFTGVPDSLLKDICAYITDQTPASNNIIAANEGGAVALAAGYHLATKKIGLVYLQNSGLGNIINPVLSLIDPDVYRIPVMFLIGWRGEPGKKDEPQHVSQGKRTLSMLESIGMSYSVVDDQTTDIAAVVSQAAETLRKQRTPHALVVREGTFASYKLRSVIKTSYPMNRESALHEIVRRIQPPDIVVSTTGKTSRELYELRDKFEQGHAQDFLTVGSMGHASMIALGIALQTPGKRVVCIDGDGACLMHMGGLAVVGTQPVKNFVHIVINNGAHDSVGGQPTVGFSVDLGAVARSVGYTHTISVERPEDLGAAMDRLFTLDGPVFLEVRVNKGAREDLGRPKSTPQENKDLFMSYIAQ